MSSQICRQRMETISEEPATFTLNTDHLSKHDLALFIESVETLSRIEREKHERQHKKATRITTQAEVYEEASILDTTQLPVTIFEDIDFEYSFLQCLSPTVSIDETEDETIIQLENKTIAESAAKSDDDSYFSRPTSQENSPRSSVIYAKVQKQNHTNNNIATNKQTSVTSDSEDSGVYAVPDPHVIESLTPLRPRSRVICHPKEHSMRSRIVGMLMKRDYSLSTSALLAEQSMVAERRDRILSEAKKQKAIKQQEDEKEAMKQKHDEPQARKKQEENESMPSKKVKKPKRTNSVNESAEERFLDRALRYLTL